VKYVQDSLAIAEEISNIKELQEIWSGLGDIMGEDTTGYYQDSVTVANLLVNLLKDSLEFINRDSIFSKVRNPKPQDSLIVAQLIVCLRTERSIRWVSKKSNRGNGT